MLEAFLLALGHLDDFIQIIRSSDNRDEARERLTAYNFPVATAETLGILIRSQASVQGDRYIFTERQVNAILELRLYQLTGLERDKIKGEYDGMLGDITDLMDILAREERVLGIIKDELREIKDKFATPRKCTIVAEEGEIAIEDLIANDAMIVTLTHRGYIKRTPSSEYRVQGRGGKGLKGMETRATSEDEADDFVEHLFSVQAHDYLMFFTNTGRMYVERVYEIPEGLAPPRAAASRTCSTSNRRKKSPRCSAWNTTSTRTVTTSPSAKKPAFVFFATRSGKVKKTALNDFRNYRKAGINAINLEEGNELIGVRLTTGGTRFARHPQGHERRASTKTTRARRAGHHGRRGIRPVRTIMWWASRRQRPAATLLVASENGIGKRAVRGIPQAIPRRQGHQDHEGHR